MQNTSVNEIRALLTRIQSTLHSPSVVMDLWAVAVADKARENARQKSTGGGFWESVSDSVKSTAIGLEAEIYTEHVAAAHKQFGGVIRARRVKHLTIPITAEAYGKTVSDFSARNLFCFTSKSLNKILSYTDASGELHPLFVLKESVTQKAYHWWPSDADVLSLGEAEFDFAINHLCGE